MKKLQNYLTGLNAPTQLPKANLLYVDIECENLTVVSDTNTEIYFICSWHGDSKKASEITTWFSVADFVHYCNLNDFYLVFHNAKFDYRALKLRGLLAPITRVIDTQVLSYLLDNTQASYSLGELTGLKEDVVDTFVKAGLLDEPVKTSEFWAKYWGDDERALELMIGYCKSDVKATRKLYNHIIRNMDKRVVEAYFTIQQPMLEVLIELESNGACIDTGLLRKLICDKEAKVAELTAEIDKNVGLLPELQWDGERYVPKEKLYKSGVYKNKRHTIPYYLDSDGVIVTAWEGHIPKEEGLVVGNHCPLVRFNSSAATGHTWWIINNHAPEVFKKAKVNKATGKPSMSKEFISKVAKKLPDWFPIGELTEIEKKLTMARSIESHLDNGRVYSNYNHTLTLTGRLSSSEPNLQNIPRAGVDEDSKAFRKLFRASEGYTYLCADLDQIELRMLAYYLALVEKDFGLLDEFNSDNPDAHTKNANTWGVERKVAKTVIFLLTYGGQPALMVDRGLVKNLKEAEEIYNNVHKNQPALQRLIDKALAKAKARGGVVLTWGGRKLNYENLMSNNKWERLRCERQVFNALLQGGAGDIIHTLAVQTLPIIRKYNGRLINIVHDEVSIEVPNAVAEQVQTELNAIWQKRTDLLVLPNGSYVTVNGDWNTGSNWAEVK